jgi:hypothetical protein
VITWDNVRIGEWSGASIDFWIDDELEKVVCQYTGRLSQDEFGRVQTEPSDFLFYYGKDGYDLHRGFRDFQGFGRAVAASFTFNKDDFLKDPDSYLEELRQS